ncbi:MAG: dipicolinate synthase subunit DpsA, partial [Sulfobacillus sp.]
MGRRVVVAGGDARDAWLCRFLIDQQYEVQSWGMTVAGVELFDPERSGPELLIGPMTGISSGGRMQTLQGSLTVSQRLLERMHPGALLAAGLIAPDVKQWASNLGVVTVEYRMQPTFMWLNAVPTAEGALRAALGRSGFTVYHRPFAVLGFGRVGSVLALRLQSYGAHVEIFERSMERRAMASAYGFMVHPLEPRWCPPVDGVFNTI